MGKRVSAANAAAKETGTLRVLPFDSILNGDCVAAMNSLPAQTGTNCLGSSPSVGSSRLVARAAARSSCLRPALATMSCASCEIFRSSAGFASGAFSGAFWAPSLPSSSL